jgi:hypothetical protein
MKNALSNQIKSKSYYIFVINVIAILLSSFGCVKPKRDVRAFAEPAIKWKMIEKCGYQRCYPMVDYLVGPDGSIRIEVIDNMRFYLVRIEFSSFKEPLELYTNKVKGIAGSTIVNPKVFYCNSMPYDYAMRAAVGVNKNIKINKNDCFIFLFDSSEFLAEKFVTLDMTEALSVRDKVLDIPIVKLIKNTEDK